MKYSLALIAAVGLAGLVYHPPALAQSKQELMLQSIQRDVAQLEGRLRGIEENQAKRSADLAEMIKQTIDAQAKLASSLTTLEQHLNKTLAEQPALVTAPVAEVRSRIDQQGLDINAVREELAAVGRRVTGMESKLEDISRGVKALATAPVVAPPPIPEAGSLESAEMLISRAKGDYSAGNDDLAMQEFVQYLHDFPESAAAPEAQYYVGMIYDRNSQYDDAIKAFDAVLERYPENPTKRNALFRKALALMKASRRAEARQEFRNFLTRYQGDPNEGQAKAYLKELGG